MSKALEVRDLVVEYPTGAGVKRSVDGLSLDVNEGEIVGVAGQSAAGKSILARALINFVPKPGRITDGSVRVFGREVLTMSESELRKLRGDDVGMIVQNARAHLNPVLRVGHQIRNVYQAHHKGKRAEVKDKVVDMLRSVGIPAPEQRYSAYPHELSGGMAQRCMIAMAMICSPKLIIGDEPTSGLDVTIQDQILRLFRKSVKEQHGTAGILVSRDMGIIANFCDRVAVMDEGKIVETAKVPEFFVEAKHPSSRALIAAASYQKGAADLEEVNRTRELT
jgi:ABC-type dipeptide/oligopeptide/nickel transport system ATPase component